jgi:hypothetical protein
MFCHNPRCLGIFDFIHIAFFANKRFVDGYNTIELMEAAESEREKEEIALVCLLDVEDGQIRDLQLCCRHAGRCKAIDCREKLIKIIEEELG